MHDGDLGRRGFQLVFKIDELFGEVTAHQAVDGEVRRTDDEARVFLEDFERAGQQAFGEVIADHRRDCRYHPAGMA